MSTRQENRQQTEENEKENSAPPPPFQSYRTRQNRAKENRKSVQSRRTHQRSAQIYSYRPGTPHSGDSHTRICTWPGSPEKFPRAQHTQLRKTEHKTINIHTPLIGITVNKKNENFHHLNAVLQHMILRNKRVNSFMSKEKRVQDACKLIKYLPRHDRITTNDWGNFNNLPARKHKKNWPAPRKAQEEALHQDAEDLKPINTQISLSGARI